MAFSGRFPTKVLSIGLMGHQRADLQHRSAAPVLQQLLVQRDELLDNVGWRMPGDQVVLESPHDLRDRVIDSRFRLCDALVIRHHDVTLSREAASAPSSRIRVSTEWQRSSSS